MAKVLFIDDVEEIRQGFEITLSAAGYDVTTVANGRDGIEALKNSSYDLVITDILMPEGDGVEVTNFIKKMEKSPGVIVISGGSESHSVEQALSYVEPFVDEFLEKPVARDQLLATLDKVLKKQLES